MKISIRIVIVLIVINLPILLFAQTAIDFGGESPYGVTDVPFDDGVGLLVAAGVVYGLLKIRAYKKAEKSKNTGFQL